MKKLITISCIAACCLITFNAQSQGFLSKLKQKVKDKVNDRIDQKTDNAIDKGLDATESALKAKKDSIARDSAAKASAVTQPAPVAQPAVAINAQATAQPAITVYNNYDFVPGDTVLFEDHFTDDQDGEFPSHWNLTKGQAVLNKMGDDLALMITDGNYAHVLPLMKTQSYFTDNFTVEYDIYANGSYPAKVYYYQNPGQQGPNFNINISSIATEYNIYGIDGATDLASNMPPDIGGKNFENKWHHIAVACKKQQLKVYVDQYRVLVVPHLPFAPVNIDIEGIGDHTKPIIIKNLRLAKGGNMNMLGKKFTDAKIITHGINFDVDKATIKPESMGTLNMIAQVLKDNPDLKFEVDGHTDNSGTAAHNLTLSQQRADAVITQLVSMGVDAGRITGKGFGDTKPIDDNNSLEGKANNRRVEFVKM